MRKNFTVIVDNYQAPEQKTMILVPIAPDVKKISPGSFEPGLIFLKRQSGRGQARSGNDVATNSRDATPD
jgi:hypothetical protein